MLVGEDSASIFTLGEEMSAGSVAKLAFRRIFGAATSSASVLTDLGAASSTVASRDFSDTRFVGEALGSSVVIASASAAHSSVSPANRTQNVNAAPDRIAGVSVRYQSVIGNEIRQRPGELRPISMDEERRSDRSSGVQGWFTK